MSYQRLTVAMDIGSVSVNTIVCNDSGKILEELPYRRHFGKTLESTWKSLRLVEEKYGADAVERVVFTGTHGETLAKELKTTFEVETTAQTRGLFEVMPTARTVVSIGGHDSALLVVNPGPQGFVLQDFKLNEACAAGTGSFIDQQAERVYSDKPEFNAIEDPQKRMEEILKLFIAEGSKSDSPASVACRCTVFTKSDMIHLQNKGIAIRHIIAGLHEGVAKNFKSTLVSNQSLEAPVAFIGGYAANPLARKAFERILGLPIEVPPHHAAVGAIGVAMNAIANKTGRRVTAEEIRGLSAGSAFAAVTSAPLCLAKSTFVECGEAAGLPTGNEKVQAYMGFDIGSTTTKMVIMSPKGDIYYKRYIPTEGQPVVAIKKCLKHVLETVDTGRIEVLGVGATGSGREVANLFVGADDVVNEVTAHARGTTFFNPNIETIFELGGQDAKYTALSKGFVVDFRMNKVCAAGTGSFLEETANKLGINISGEYEKLALAAPTPYKLTERCTVFMESDLMSFLQMGALREDLLAGLSRAVVHNYLNRVVQDGKIGNIISFQGGPSLNKSVVAAFEAVVGKPIVTLPHREVMGAIGSALHCREDHEARRARGENVASRFRGWKVIDSPFSHEEEVCYRNPKCHNLCKLQVYKVANDEAVYGGECGMYESRSGAAKRAPDYNRIRHQLFFKTIEGKYKVLLPDGSYITGGRNEKAEAPTRKRPTIGVPRSLTFFQLGNFWVSLLDSLGFDVILSPETDNPIVDLGIEAMTCEACFPVKISHGHAKYLKDKVDYLFMPVMIEMEAPPKKKGYYCPYIEANTYMLKAALDLNDSKLVMPAVYLKEGRAGIKKVLGEELRRLGLPFSESVFDQAYENAWKARTDFETEIKRVGASVLENLGERRAIVVVGRPYSAYDSRTNLSLFNTFSRLGVIAIPQEFLAIDNLPIEHDFPNMYWGSGDKILKAAKFINDDPRLFGLYLTSFSCGPDSFILHFFNHEMNRTGRPYLELELDEHSAGAGVETRLLAFIDVIKNQHDVRTLPKNVAIHPKPSTAPLRGRTLYVPKMAEGSHHLAAAFRAVGHKAQVMPTYTKAGLEFGKSHTSGKECFPCTVTTGDMFDLLHGLKKDGTDIKNNLAFFMPETEGPCRFGQYNRLHRILLNSYGLNDVPIISPSSEDSYRCNGLFSDEEATEFRKLAWQAIVYADIMEKALWRIRPYETVKGTTDLVFQKHMKAGVKAVEQGGGLKLLKAAKQAAREFAAIERSGPQKPVVGIVGEIYVRTHRESNQDLVRSLEALGLETYTSSIAEWIDYTSHTSLTDNLQAYQNDKNLANFFEYAKDWGTGKYQKMVSWMLSRPFAEMLSRRFDHDTGHLLHLVEGMFSNHINGEAILSIAGAVAFEKDGFNGVVNALPFTCMPSTIASAILKVHARQKIPYVDMIYDGSILPNRGTNLATFAFQVKQHQEKPGNRRS
jgi:predicted CoA-substrate-specific enzyme activase